MHDFTYSLFGNFETVFDISLSDEGTPYEE